MAVQDHLKVASAELAKASSLVRQQIDQLRAEESKLQQSVDKQTALLSSEIQLRQKEINNTDDSHRQAQARSTVLSLQRQIAETRSQLGTDLKRIQDSIREKEQTINALNQQARAVQ